MNIAAMLAKAALTFPDRPAISWGKEQWADYKALHRSAGIIGQALREDYGLEPGDRVAIAMPNRPEFLEAQFGIWYAGLVAVLVNSKLHVFV